MIEEKNIDNRYAFFDVDGTLYKGATTHDLIDFFKEIGFIEDDTHQKYWGIMDSFKKGEKTFAQGSREIVDLIHSTVKNYRVDQIQIIMNDFFKAKHQIFDFMFDVIHFLKKNNFQIILVSAGILPAVESIGNIIGADYVFASEPELTGNIYTGNVSKFLHGEEKKKVVEEIINKIKEEKFIVAFGDSSGDLDMLKLSDVGVLINPGEKELIPLAIENDWLISNSSDEIIELIQDNLSN